MTILCASSLNDRPLRNRSPSGKSFDPKWRSGRNVIGVLMDIAMGVEVSEIGDLHRGRPYACNFALVYTGVIVFGQVNIRHGPESRDKRLGSSISCWLSTDSRGGHSIRVIR